jgi:hypothetical protein
MESGCSGNVFWQTAKIDAVLPLNSDTTARLPGYQYPTAPISQPYQPHYSTLWHPLPHMHLLQQLRAQRGNSIRPETTQKREQEELSHAVRRTASCCVRLQWLHAMLGTQPRSLL